MRRTGYEVGHIPGAVHFNPIRFGRQKRTDDSAHDVAFESLMTRLGISNMRRVVLYDERGGVTRLVSGGS
jgi:3-mercaptopyruvate sulfurtransferase SseA